MKKELNYLVIGAGGTGGCIAWICEETDPCRLPLGVELFKDRPGHKHLASDN